METSMAMCSRFGLLKNIILLFTGKKEEIPRPEDEVSTAVKKELDKLWSLLREQNEKKLYDIDLRKEITESYCKVSSRFSAEQLDSVHAWPRFVKIAVQSEPEPIAELVNYVNTNNYIPLTKRLSNLSKSVYNYEGTEVKNNIDNFSEAVYRHILDTINPRDIPSCLALGRAAQKRGEYKQAREWFCRIIEEKDGFNGLTALLACYEEETKRELKNAKSNHVSDYDPWEKVRELNKCQCAAYEEWLVKMDTIINTSAEISVQYKKDYVALVTGFARFERNRGNYDKAFELLQRIPESFPDIYRVYSEEAMLYQFKPYKNPYYDLNKAIMVFIEADESIDAGEPHCTVNAKSRKSILMPLANAYFKLGRYNDAVTVCDRVLMIDSNEQRAADLKNRIANLLPRTMAEDLMQLA